MRLVFAIKGLAGAVGGAERVFCTICSELARRGHDVSILTFDQPNECPFYPLDARVRKVDLGIGNSAKPARLRETISRILALRRMMQAERPDVAVGFMHSMFVPLAFALAGTGMPVIGSEHIVPEHYRSRPFECFLLKLSASFLSKLTVLSDAIRCRYPNAIRRRMVVMPNPVSPASRLANVTADKDHFTLLCVGRLDAQKDHETLLKAFAMICNDFSKWRLRIVGEGPLRADLEELLDMFSLRGKVDMPGIISDIGAEYASADIFVLPSRYESFGLVTAEAMSYGLPVIGFTDCPGTNELICAGKTGLLVEPGRDRVGALASALSGLIKDVAARKRLSVAGRVAMKEHFSVQHICDQWEHLLRSLIKPT